MPRVPGLRLPAGRPRTGASAGGSRSAFDLGGGLNALGSGLPPDVASNLQDAKKSFTASGGGGVRPVLPETLIDAASPYLLQAGHTVSAALITEINTDLPGRIIAQITEPVFDSVTGRHLLIPQGAKLLGSYDSLVSNGQDRALLVWERLIMPNGQSVLLDAMLGTDATGAAGKKDKVDYHLGRLLGGVLLSTAITFGANSARDRDGSRDEDLVGDSIAQESSRIGSTIVDRTLAIQPTITIRQGARVRVLVEEDIILEPYRYPSP